MYLAYCDDEEIQLEFVKNLTGQWAAERGVSLHFSAYRSAEELLFEHTSLFPFNLLILDIDMKGMDGMALARRVRNQDGKLPILFLTNHKEYVFEGYEVGAYRYLLKPLHRETYFPLLDKFNAAENKEKRYLLENVSGETVKIDMEEILYLEAEGHYLNIHTTTEIYKCKKNFHEAIKAIESYGFVGTHRSFFVNLRYVERILRTECVLSDGSRIPISRSSYKEVNEAFLSWYKKTT